MISVVPVSCKNNLMEKADALGGKYYYYVVIAGKKNEKAGLRTRFGFPIPQA
ncbi:hypothetical protein EDF73_11517 [Raoultella sp. BIGb0138]|nr:hypothetical protein EDF73_11517 [Raoultella sp. BIGb0138]